MDDKQLDDRLRALGLLDLADKYSLDQSERRILLVRADADQIELQRHLEESRLDQILASATTIHSHMFDQISRYNNLILTLGYAGIFALWTLTKEYLPKEYALIVGTSVGLSLLLFVGWTIYNAYFLTSYRNILAAAHLAEHKTSAEKLENTRQAEYEVAQKQMAFLRPYPYVFGASVFFGIVGAVISLVVLVLAIHSAWTST